MIRFTFAVLFLGLQACWGAITGMTAGQLPVAFEPNRGQWATGIDYGAHVGGHLYTFSGKGIVIDGAIHFDLVSTSRGKFEALDPIEGKTNYLTGRDPKKWIIGVRNYSRIRYQNAFPGVDLVLYGSHGQLEFDYLIAPRASPNAIRLRVRGASVRGSAEGLDLTALSGETIQLRTPVAYQEADSGRHSVRCRFQVRTTNEIALVTTGFDPTLPLVIDPVLTYLTAVVGTFTSGTPIYPMVTDLDGNFYLAGTLTHASIPVTDGALQTKSPCPPMNVYVPNYNCTGGWAMKFSVQHGLIWATYIGGSTDYSWVDSMALDASGNMVLGGQTCSLDFPVTPDAYQPTMPPVGNYHCAGFLAKLNPTGTAMEYATFLEVAPEALKLDLQGNIYYVCLNMGRIEVRKMSADGKTPLLAIPVSKSATIPVWYGSMTLDDTGNLYVLTPRWPGFQVTAGAYKDSDHDAEVILKYDPLGNLLFAASVNANSELSRDIVVDAVGNIVFAGKAGAGFPVVNDPDPQANDCEPGVQCMAYVAALDPTGSFLRYTRLLGDGEAQKLSFDGNGDLWVAGVAFNANRSFSSGFFPRTRDAFQFCSMPMDGQGALSVGSGGDSGPHNGFIMRLDPTGNRKFSSFLGTLGTTVSYLQPSTSGQLYVGGWGTELVTENGPYYFVGAIDTAQSPRTPHACLVNATQNIIDVNVNTSTIAPGEIVTLFGEGLGPLDPVNGQWNDAGALSTELGGVQVLFDGIPSPLLYAQYNQINCIVPFGVASRQTTTVVAQYGGLQTDPMTFQVAPAVVNVFTRDQWPSSDVIAVNEDGTMNSADHPAARGSVITLFATGGGAVGMPLQDGQIVHDASSAVSPLSVDFYDASPFSIVKTAEVQYFGTAPGQVAGIYQLNVKVPADAATGRTHIAVHSASWGVEGVWLK